MRDYTAANSRLRVRHYFAMTLLLAVSIGLFIWWPTAVHGQSEGWPRDSYNGPGGGLYTGPGGGLYDGPGGGLYDGPGGGLYDGPSSEPYHRNWPPREVFLAELLKRGLNKQYQTLKKAWGL